MIIKKSHWMHYRNGYLGGLIFFTQQFTLAFTLWNYIGKLYVKLNFIL